MKQVLSSPPPLEAISAPPTARWAFMRPPEATRPAREGRASTELIKIEIMRVALKPGDRALIRAAVPETIPAAMEVPLEKANPPGQVLTMLSPGAARSTELAPKFENDARLSF